MGSAKIANAPSNNSGSATLKQLWRGLSIGTSHGAAPRRNASSRQWIMPNLRIRSEAKSPIVAGYLAAAIPLRAPLTPSGVHGERSSRFGKRKPRDIVPGLVVGELPEAISILQRPATVRSRTDS